MTTKIISIYIINIFIYEWWVFIVNLDLFCEFFCFLSTSAKYRKRGSTFLKTQLLLTLIMGLHYVLCIQHSYQNIYNLFWWKARLCVIFIEFVIQRNHLTLAVPLWYEKGPINFTLIKNEFFSTFLNGWFLESPYGLSTLRYN